MEKGGGSCREWLCRNDMTFLHCHSDAIDFSPWSFGRWHLDFLSDKTLVWGMMGEKIRRQTQLIICRANKVPAVFYCITSLWMVTDGISQFWFLRERKTPRFFFYCLSMVMGFSFHWNVFCGVFDCLILDGYVWQMQQEWMTASVIWW